MRKAPKARNSCEERERDRHVDLSNAAFVAWSNLLDTADCTWNYYWQAVGPGMKTVMVMSKNSNSITATLARGRELRAIAQQQDPRLAASEALGLLQRHRKVLGLPEVLEQPLHYVVAAFAEVERGNRAALFEPMKKGRPPDPAAKRDIRVKVALVIDLLEAADRTREQAARQVARELQLRGIAIKCRSSKGDVPEWRKVLEWRNELRRARQGWSPADIYCFQRYRYLKIVRRGKLKPETEARRLLATLRPPRSPQCCAT